MPGRGHASPRPTQKGIIKKVEAELFAEEEEVVSIR